jgi:hypothetical protein
VRDDPNFLQILNDADLRKQLKPQQLAQASACSEALYRGNLSANAYVGSFTVKNVPSNMNSKTDFIKSIDWSDIRQQAMSGMASVNTGEAFVSKCLFDATPPPHTEDERDDIV